MIYKPQHFELHELLPKYFYNEYKTDEDKLWLMFDQNFLRTLSQLRCKYGIITLNDWYWGDRNQYCGWRPWNCKIGTKFSQHKFGRAGDLYFEEGNVKHIAEDIRKNILRFPHIKFIKTSVSRIHFDCGNR